MEWLRRDPWAIRCWVDLNSWLLFPLGRVKTSEAGATVDKSRWGGLTATLRHRKTYQRSAQISPEGEYNRMIKTIVAAAGLSIGLLMMPAAMAPAHAGINLDINIGKKQISCGRGRRIVEDYGYWDVRTRDCVGRNYTYF